MFRKKKLVKVLTLLLILVILAGCAPEVITETVVETREVTVKETVVVEEQVMVTTEETERPEGDQ